MVFFSACVYLDSMDLAEDGRDHHRGRHRRSTREVQT
jgi:hypothetical protein